MHGDKTIPRYPSREPRRLVDRGEQRSVQAPLCGPDRDVMLRMLSQVEMRMYREIGGDNRGGVRPCS
jgi:hypothetical protein